MRRFVMAGCALGLVSNAPAMPDEYTLLCETEQATGFNWEDRKFVRTSFRLQRFIVTRKHSNLCPGITSLEPLEPFSENIDWAYSKNVCLNVREFGSEYKPEISDKCVESYIRPNDGKWMRQFNCDGIFTNIKGEFNGYFRTFSDTSVTTNPKNDYRDSLLIAVGRCSVIS